MKKVLLAILSLALCTSAIAQESQANRRSRRGEAAGYSTRNASALSMMGWGVGIAVTFAAICALIDNHTDGDGNHCHCH